MDYIYSPETNAKNTLSNELFSSKQTYNFNNKEIGDKYEN